MQLRPGAILEEHGKILLLRYEYPAGAVLGIPGGKPEKEETLAQALRREVMEELNITIRIGEILLVAEAEAISNLPRTLHILFRCDRVSGEPTPCPQFTSAKEAIWVPLLEIYKETLYPNVATLLSRALMYKGSLYIEELPVRDWR